MNCFTLMNTKIKHNTYNIQKNSLSRGEKESNKIQFKYSIFIIFFSKYLTKLIINIMLLKPISYHFLIRSCKVILGVFLLKCFKNKRNL